MFNQKVADKATFIIGYQCRVTSQKYRMLELNKVPLNTAQNEAFTSLRTRWQGIVEVIGTKVRESNSYIFIPTFAA